MEKFDSLLWKLPGRVDLAKPEHILGLIEDCRGPDGAGGAVRVLEEEEQQEEEGIRKACI